MNNRALFEPSQGVSLTFMRPTYKVYAYEFQGVRPFETRSGFCNTFELGISENWIDALAISAARKKASIAGAPDKEQLTGWARHSAASSAGRA